MIFIFNIFSPCSSEYFFPLHPAGIRSPLRILKGSILAQLHTNKILTSVVYIMTTDIVWVLPNVFCHSDIARCGSSLNFLPLHRDRHLFCRYFQDGFCQLKRCHAEKINNQQPCSWRALTKCRISSVSFSSNFTKFSCCASPEAYVVFHSAMPTWKRDHRKRGMG